MKYLDPKIIEHGRCDVTFGCLFPSNPTDAEIAEQQRLKGYAKGGYGGPWVRSRESKPTETHPGAVYVTWSCQASCD